MKVTSSNTSPIPLTKTAQESSSKPSSAKKTSHSSSAQARQRISSWFTQIGISPNADLSSYKMRTAHAYRHNDIRKVKRVENLSAIMNLAMNVAVGDIAQSNIDADWFHAFVDLAENIYSSEMQELWGKILAVEISRPGSFSLRSLDTLRLLTQREAQTFAAACRLASRRAGDPVPRIILHYHQRKTLSRLFMSYRSTPVNLANYGLSYPSLLALIDVGLIMPSEIESAEFPQGQAIQFRCGEVTYSLTSKRSGVALAYYKFSSVGAELFMLSKKHEHTDYLAALKQTLSPAFSVK